VSDIRVLVVDDHAVVREGLRAFLELQDGISVVGEADEGRAAIESARLLRPDVVLLDLVMPEVGGLEALPAIIEASPDTKVIVLTSFDDQARVVEAIASGASGYLLKDARPGDIAAAVRTVVDGGAPLHPSAAAGLMSSFRSRSVPSALDALTPREREVLDLIANGLANKQIAARLGLSLKTIKTHVSNILQKLQVADRTQAAVLAVREGARQRPRS
jgi:NarL family two-component system response regulator LiaR